MSQYTTPVQPITRHPQITASQIIAPTKITFPQTGLLECTWEFENGATVNAHYTTIEGPWETVITFTSGQTLEPGPLPYTYQLQAWVQWAALLPPTRHPLVDVVVP